jgi:hypothetical protein
MFVREIEWDRDEERKVSISPDNVAVSDSVRSFRYLSYVMDIYIRIDAPGYVGDSNSFRAGWVKNRKFYRLSLAELLEAFEKAVDEDVKALKRLTNS